MIQLKYLIVGTGRCGTVYTAKLLTSLGINCSHEAIFNYRGLDFAKKVLNQEEPLVTSHCSMHEILNNCEPLDPWLDESKVEAESSYMATPFLDNPILENTKIIHLVRNPLKVISSFVEDIHFFRGDGTNLNVYRNFIGEFLPEIWSIENEIERACYYYIHWNKMIENSKKEKIFCKLENLNPLFEIFGKPTSQLKNSTKNSWKNRQFDLSLSSIPEGSIKKEFIEIMNKYKYFNRLF
jgi:hypothetical protein